MKKSWGLLVAITLGITGCGGENASEAASQETAAQPSAVATEAAARESTCADVPGDSTSTLVDLEKVQLINDGKLMFLAFSTVADVPPTGTVLYSATAWSEDGNTGYQMGAKFQDGQEIANFVYNMNDATQKNITNKATAAEKQVSMRYPLAELEGLGDSFTWSGTVTVEGTDVDKYPEDEEKASFPDA